MGYCTNSGTLKNKWNREKAQFYICCLRSSACFVDNHAVQVSQFTTTTPIVLVNTTIIALCFWLSLTWDETIQMACSLWKYCIPSTTIKPRHVLVSRSRPLLKKGKLKEETLLKDFHTSLSTGNLRGQDLTESVLLHKYICWVSCHNSTSLSHHRHFNMSQVW